MTEYIVHYTTKGGFTFLKGPVNELEAGRFAAGVIEAGATNVKITCKERQPEADLIGVGL